MRLYGKFKNRFLTSLHKICLIKFNFLSGTGTSGSSAETDLSRGMQSICAQRCHRASGKKYILSKHVYQIFFDNSIKRYFRAYAIKLFSPPSSRDSICGAQFPGERIELLLPEFDKDSVTAMLRLLTCGEASGAPAAAALELMAALGADLTQFEVEGGAGLGGGDPPTEEVENREDPSPPPPHEGGDPLQVDQAVGTEQVPPLRSGGDLEATVGGTVEGGEEESSTGEGLQCFACDTALGSGEDLLTHLSLVHFRASLLDDCGGCDRLRCHKCGEEFGEEDGLLRHFGVAHAVAVKYVPGEQKEKVGSLVFFTKCIYIPFSTYSIRVWNCCKSDTRGTGTWSSRTRMTRASRSNSAALKPGPG